MRTVTRVVMAHPRRATWAHQVAEEADAVIVWDEVGEPWDTGKRALTYGAESGADYVCVLQDDIILSEGLVGVIDQIVQYCGEHPVGLYAGRGQRVDAALKHDPDPWWAGTGPIWGPGIIVPTEDVRPIIRFGDPMRIRSYDTRLWRFYQRAHILCWYTAPSLVQHRTGHGSLISKGRDREAGAFGSGVGKDWSVPPVKLDNQTLYPRITLVKDGRQKVVRKGSRTWRLATRAGWVEV